MNRAVDLPHGTAYVVADLHGSWEPYTRYRDNFLALHARGKADWLVFLGDVIHGYGAEEDDASVAILLDIMRLQAELGAQTVSLLLGNHEMSHIYFTPLTKGERAFMPRFERLLGNHREQVTPFLKSLPFLARTPGGVLLVHAGASEIGATVENAARILSWSHGALFDEVDQLLALGEVHDLLRAFGLAEEEYDRDARENLAVSGPDDPRYRDLLRGFIASSLEPEWPLLWDFFFTQCEAERGRARYKKIVRRFLKAYSSPGLRQRVLVSGHIVVAGGYAFPTEETLRLASWTHARPHQAGCYLLFDVTRPVMRAADLEPFLSPLP